MPVSFFNAPRVGFIRVRTALRSSGSLVVEWARFSLLRSSLLAHPFASFEPPSLCSGTVLILTPDMQNGRPADADLPFCAPRVGFEPTTLRLTAACSTAELPRSVLRNSGSGRKDRTILDAGQASLRPFQLQPGKRSLSRSGMPTDPVSQGYIDTIPALIRRGKGRSAWPHPPYCSSGSWRVDQTTFRCRPWHATTYSARGTGPIPACGSS